MQSLVHQLQQDALDRSIEVSDLLLKAKLVAVKLGVVEAQSWIDCELGGYEVADVPSYRRVRGQPRAMDPYTGRWVPLRFGNDRHQEAISVRPLVVPASELEGLVDRSEPLIFSFAPSAVSLLADAFRIETTSMGQFVDVSAIRGVLAAVRKRVLDWALALEQAGVFGEGLAFSTRDKEIAAGVTFNVGRIDNFTGNIGPVSGDQTFNAPLDLDALRSLVDQILTSKGAMFLPPEREAELDESLSALDAELAKPAPDEGVIARLLGSVKRIAEGASGNVIAAGVVHLLGTINPHQIHF